MGWVALAAAVVGSALKSHKSSGAAAIDPQVNIDQNATIAANAQMATTRRRRQMSSLLAGGSSVLGAPAYGATSGAPASSQPSPPPSSALAAGGAAASRAIQYGGYGSGLR